MNGLLKAMLKGSKREVETQVYQGELIWYPEMIILDVENREFKKNMFDFESNSY
jgi:hypothetical protein